MRGSVFHIQLLVGGLTLFLMLIGLAPCSLAADAARGEIIAKRWCAACHVVSPEQTRASADVPSFAAIAHRKLPAEHLKTFLTDPHPVMPDMNLTRNEIEDIVAYIKSLDR